MIAFTILGEPASKANSRKLATVGKADARRTIFIKSDKARDYERTAALQIPQSARQMLEGPVFVSLRIFYASERPDLDESVVLDVLQAKYERIDGKRVLVSRGVYINDRQVRKKLVEHFIDRTNPRAEITVEPMQPQQPALIANDPPLRPIRDARKRGAALPPSHPTPKHEFSDIPF